MSDESIMGESNSRRRLSIPEVKTAFKEFTENPRKFKMPEKSLLGEYNGGRRLSIPEVKTAFKDITGSPRKFKNPLGSPRRSKSPKIDNEYCDLNDGGLAIISKSRLTMDRVHTPEPTSEDQPDGAFSELRPASPFYIQRFQRYGSIGDSQESSDDDDEDIHTEKSSKSKPMKMRLKSTDDTQEFQVVKIKSYSKRRYLIKVPIENKIVQRCEDVHILEDTACPRYPTCMQSYKRGVSPTPPEMVEPKEQSLSSLRAKTKLRISNMYRKNIEILQLRFAACEMEPELEKMEKEMNKTNDVDLLHIMDNDGKIMWKDIDDSDTEAVLETEIDSMPTLDQNKFKDLDPQDILDAYLTEKYIVLESEKPLIQI